MWALKTMQSVHASMMHEASTLTSSPSDAEKLGRKLKMFLVVIAMQDGIVGWFPKDGKWTQMSYKGIVYAFVVLVSSC